MTADLVLYRRMRGIFWGLLFVGILLLPTLLVLGVTVPMHFDAYPADFREEAGRANDVFAAGFALSGVVASIAAVILGATAGSVDHQRGVLRDLVLAGRSRTRIVLGRLAAAVTILALALLASFAVTILVGLLLAPVDSTIDWGRAMREALQYAPGLTYTMPFAAGVALLIGSRGPAIAVYFVVALIVDNVLSVIPKVGDWWQHVSLTQADQQVNAWVRDLPYGGPTERPEWAAALVLAGWAIIPFVAGLVRLSRRDL